MASKLTKAARGQECQVQLYPYCNENPETVIFAHAPSEDKGWSIKSQDFWGSFCCSACHDILDGRRHVDDITELEITEAFMRGIHRTIKLQIEAELIKI